MPKFAANLHIRVGPGPIDLFATRFNNLFEDDVTCTVNGEQIEGGKEGLKQVILGYKEKGLIIEDTQPETALKLKAPESASDQVHITATPSTSDLSKISEINITNT